MENKTLTFDSLFDGFGAFPMGGMIVGITSVWSAEIERCSAKTVQRLAKALDCTMEDIMELSSPYDSATGLPKDKSYLERDLPPFLMESIAAMKDAWKKLDGGEPYLRWDCDYCNLQTDINNAEVNQIIDPEQAWYLREKYLRLERG